MNLSEKQREAAFPVHIDLGKKEVGMNATNPGSPSGKKGKPRTYYPTVYIDSVPGLGQLPKEGCILIKYRRTRLSIDEDASGEETTGATIEIHALCLPENMAEYAMDDLESVLKNAGKAKSSKDESPDDDDDDYEDEE